MKTLLRVAGIIAVIITLLVSAGGAFRNFDDAGKAEGYEQELADGKAQLETLKQQSEMMDGPEKELMQEDIKNAEEALKDAPSKSAFTIAGIMCGIVAILAVFVAVLLFKPGKQAMLILGAMILVTLILILVSPDPKGSITSGASNRTLAIIAAVPGIISALCAYMIARKSGVTA
ncbi:MAG TPA: hypothetical protein VGB50_10240 [Flavobacterium sp.]|jgi:Flp pilus assembly protein TadB